MRIKSVLKQVFLTEKENKKLNDCMRKENIRNFSEFASLNCQIKCILSP